ncbi:MAG: LacI family DNA-binding transcriptional regulator [Opitutaceae bacterium]|nr:LacI family DNA-binding transcriptional regulator [Opitutaceae bacterium]
MSPAPLPPGCASAPVLETPAQETAAPALRVTQQDVARAAGVHNSTVSLALRGSTSISKATRERVRRIAAAMGYAPDPAVQALVAYRNRLVRRQATAAIAFVTNGPSEYGWRADPACEANFCGAQARAGELGFTLDHFWAGESGLSQRRLNHILFHRSITGVVFLTLGRGVQSWAGLNWARLSAVAIGAREVSPFIHRVTTDPAGNLRLAVRRAREAGYRRIGVVLPQACDEASDGAWAQAFAAELARAGSAVVPVLGLRGEAPDWEAASRGGLSEIEAGRLAQWIGRHEPDVLLGWGSWIQPILAMLGMVVPRDIAFLDLDRADGGRSDAGIRQNHRAVGAIAVERVVHLLQQNLRGAPGIPTRTLVEGAWGDGESMPRLERVPGLALRVGGGAAELVGASIA